MVFEKLNTNKLLCLLWFQKIKYQYKKLKIL